MSDDLIVAETLSALIEARKADEKHRAEINGKIVGALMAAGLGKTTAKIVVEAIAGGSIPHVRIEY